MAVVAAANALHRRDALCNAATQVRPPPTNSDHKGSWHLRCEILAYSSDVTVTGCGPYPGCTEHFIPAFRTEAASQAWTRTTYQELLVLEQGRRKNIIQGLYEEYIPLFPTKNHQEKLTASTLTYICPRSEIDPTSWHSTPSIAPRPHKP